VSILTGGERRGKREGRGTFVLRRPGKRGRTAIEVFRFLKMKGGEDGEKRNCRIVNGIGEEEKGTYRLQQSSSQNVRRGGKKKKGRGKSELLIKVVAGGGGEGEGKIPNGGFLMHLKEQEGLLLELFPCAWPEKRGKGQENTLVLLQLS